VVHEFRAGGHIFIDRAKCGYPYYEYRAAATEAPCPGLALTDDDELLDNGLSGSPTP
jgi:hypothetical protein